MILKPSDFHKQKPKLEHALNSIDYFIMATAIK